MIPKYTDADIFEKDGQFCIYVDGGTMSSGNRQTLLKSANSRAAAQLRPTLFLEAWKEAVVLAGKNYFIIKSSSVDTAADKNELQPDWEVITHSLGVISGGERRFLIAIYQFYHDTDILKFCRENEIEIPSMSDLATLDQERVNVLCRLMQSYAGW